MTADAGEQHTDPQNDAPKDAQKGDGEAKFTQAQLNSFLASQRREIESRFTGFDELKAKAEQFDQLNDEKKSEVERATEQAQAAAAERDTFRSDNEKLKVQLLRQKISATKGLDPDLWDRVIGSTEEEITADVERLVEKFAPAPKRSGALRSGASAPEGTSGKERAAAALRGLRRD
jgi:hypothetical protein